MTLLLTEVHVGDTLRDSIIFFAADRRISKDYRFRGLSKKIYEIPYLNAGIGFFGLADFERLGKTHHMRDWLKSLIDKNHGIRTLGDFAHTLANDLTNFVPMRYKLNNPSGFHLAGYNDQGFPEFWFIRNIRAMDDVYYRGFDAHYTATEDFLSRDARNGGFDGIHPSVPRPFRAVYRNGDIRGHAAVWDKADQMIKMLTVYPGFNIPATIKGYKEYMEFKMKIIASIYKKYNRRSTIGSPIDTLHLPPTQGRIAIKRFP